MTTRPRLLDLFCGAGGSVGYHRAGFEVIGVDINPQPNYPYEFFQADATTFPLIGYDAIHASPPCQDHSRLSKNYGAPVHGTGNLLGAILERLDFQPIPWVIENVEDAHLPGAIILCGASFGLGASGLDLPRHRKFLSRLPLMAPPCSHRPGKTMGVYGNGINKWHREKLGRNLTAAEMREAMGIDWMNRKELSQAIPPAYTEYIGKQLIERLT